MPTAVQRKPEEVMAEYRRAYHACHGTGCVIICRGGRYFINPYEDAFGVFHCFRGHTKATIVEATDVLSARAKEGK